MANSYYSWTNAASLPSSRLVTASSFRGFSTNDEKKDEDKKEENVEEATIVEETKDEKAAEAQSAEIIQEDEEVPSAQIIESEENAVEATRSSVYDRDSFEPDNIELDFKDDVDGGQDYKDERYGWNATDKWTQLLLQQQLDEDGKPKPKVTTYHKKRYPFYKQPYMENHIPLLGKYAKIRQSKPKLAQWDNPKYDWPPTLPRPTMHKGKTLIQQVENEERDRINQERKSTFQIPNYRTGDVLKVSLLDSISEGNLKQWTGVCFASYRTSKSIKSKVAINMNLDGVNTQLFVPLYSPLTQKVEIAKYGFNNSRKKMNHIPAMDIPAGRLREPIRKHNRFMRPRGAKSQQHAQARSKGQSSNKGKIRRYIDAQSGVKQKSQ